MLGLARFLPKWAWSTEIEPYEDDEDDEDTEMAPLWQRPARVPTDQERADGEAKRKAAMEALRYDPDRPRLETYVRVPEPPSAPEPPQHALRATTDAPQAPGIYLMRHYPGDQWRAVEVLADVKGALWYGWQDYEPARPVAGSRLIWLEPALEGGPRG